MREVRVAKRPPTWCEPTLRCKGSGKPTPQRRRPISHWVEQTGVRGIEKQTPERVGAAPSSLPSLSCLSCHPMSEAPQATSICVPRADDSRYIWLNRTSVRYPKRRRVLSLDARICLGESVSAFALGPGSTPCYSCLSSIWGWFWSRECLSCAFQSSGGRIAHQQARDRA